MPENCKDCTKRINCVPFLYIFVNSPYGVGGWFNKSQSVPSFSCGLWERKNQLLRPVGFFEGKHHMQWSNVICEQNKKLAHLPVCMFANSGRARAHSHGHAHDCRHGHARGYYHGHKKHIKGIAHGYSHGHAHYILAVPMTLSMGTIAISGWVDGWIRSYLES